MALYELFNLASNFLPLVRKTMIIKNDSCVYPGLLFC